MTEKQSQTKEELKNHLMESISFMQASSEAFDGGYTAEAKRLATTIRVLLHDTRRSQSLLGLLGVKEQLRFVNTAFPYDPKNLVAHNGLVGFRVKDGKAGYWAPLDDGPPPRYTNPPVEFYTWWNELVVVDRTSASFSRKDLVLTLANKDGGAHVDPDLDKAYADLTRGSSMGWFTSNGEEDVPLRDIELHSLRQIAFELLNTLDSHTVDQI